MWLALLAACGGEGEIGDDCETPGSRDECVDDAICTNDDVGRYVCRKWCNVQSDCPPDENCNGITGSSSKSCQPK